MTDKERNDGKVGINFRIPIELEKAFRKYCTWRDDPVSKSEVISKLIIELLQKEKISGQSESNM